jgi:hypothetical protein
MSHQPESTQSRNGDHDEQKQEETQNFGVLPSNLAHSPLAAFIEVNYLHNIVLFPTRFSATALTDGH